MSVEHFQFWKINLKDESKEAKKHTNAISCDRCNKFKIVYGDLKASEMRKVAKNCGWYIGVIGRKRDLCPDCRKKIFGPAGHGNE